MAFGKLENCPRCGKLFVRAVKDICPDCIKKVEEEYEKCARFLRNRENRNCTIYDLSEATGVTVRQITRFILEGRISIEGNPNLGYPCESCGTLIRKGALCDQCAGRLNKQVKEFFDQEKKQQEKEKSDSAYFHKKDN